MMSPAKYAFFLAVAVSFFSDAIPSLPAETLAANTRSDGEKLTHLHFYVQSLASGPNASSVPVARALTMANTTTAANPLFGMVVVIDDALTEGPERSSKQIGNAQGIVVVASQIDAFLLEMVVSYIFTEGRYSGSSVSVLGRNPAGASIRELPILGGTGAFRFARGYVLTRTYSADFKNGVAVFEYNMYVLHR